MDFLSELLKPVADIFNSADDARRKALEAARSWLDRPDDGGLKDPGPSFANAQGKLNEPAGPPTPSINIEDYPLEHFVEDNRKRNYDDNIRNAYEYLTSPQVTKASKGLIEPLTKEQAAALIGNWQHETGSPDLSNLDVVEIGNNGAGRGLSQWTASRRGPYDAARQDYIKKGGDPNDLKFQLDYFSKEYTNPSLIGWTKTFENTPKTGNVNSLSDYYSDTYFRPGTPHKDSRRRYANQVLARINNNWK